MPTFVQMKASRFIMCSMRSRVIILLCVLLLLVFQFASQLAHIPYEIHRFVVLASVKHQKHGQVYNTTNVEADPILIPETKSKYAFATFLTGGDDHYFVGTRILAYQLLHAHDTRSKDHEIPFIVLVTDSVNEEDRARLRKDGAIVVVQDAIREEWVLPGVDRWADVLTKLRFWQLTQFERICFLDGDTVLAHSLDDIFLDDALLEIPSGTDEKQIFDDEAKLPKSYSFASTPALLAKHHYPPTEKGGDFRMDYLVRLQPELQSHFYSFKSTTDLLSRMLAFLPSNLMLRCSSTTSQSLTRQTNSTQNIRSRTYSITLIERMATCLGCS